MANTRSALKRIRQNEARTLHNKSAKSRLKTARKAAATALAAGDMAEAEKRARVAISLADRAARGRAIHRNAASRIKRQLTNRLTAKKKA